MSVPNVSVPNKQEYNGILNRLQEAMIYSCSELSLLAQGVVEGLSQKNAAEISERMLKLGRVLERIGNDSNNPVPLDLPNASTESHAVGV